MPDRPAQAFSGNSDWNPRSSAPRGGDIVVSREAGASARFTLRQIPSSVQLTTASQDEALGLGRGFALAHGVDLWYADEHRVRLLEEGRPPEADARSTRRVPAGQ
jgi:hypothetical protein